MKKTGYKYLSLMIGVMAAIVIMVSQCFSLKNVVSEKFSKSAKTEIQSSKDDHSDNDAENVLTIAATSFPASAQVNFIQEASCLFEICFSEELELEVDITANLEPNKFFSTILQVIISPNAP